MALTATPNTHAPFIQALKDLDPILAGVFMTVQEQTSDNRNWQYMWASYQQEQGTITPDREADKIFQAFTLTQPDIHSTPENSVNWVATAMSNPYHRMLDDYEHSEAPKQYDVAIRAHGLDQDEELTCKDWHEVQQRCRTLEQQLDESHAERHASCENQDGDLSEDACAFCERGQKGG